MDNKLTQKQKKFLDRCVSGKWYYQNGVVNVEGGVDMIEEGFTSIPVQFGIVTGNFSCSNNKLTSLKGCPSKVGEQFYCDSNLLTSLEYCPLEINTHFSCSYNELTSLKGCPQKVKFNFYCNNNELTSLQHCPVFGAKMNCTHNSFILNDELFEDIKRIGNKNNIYSYDDLLYDLKEAITTQFGVTNKKVINEIWRSYMNILEGKK